MLSHAILTLAQTAPAASWSNPDVWITAGVLLVVIGGLSAGRFSADLVLLSGLAALLLFGVIDTGEAVSGFANPAVWTVAFLYIVAAGLRHTGALSSITSWGLGRPRTVAGAQARILLPVAGASAVMNNTPIVAMFLPVLKDWAARNKIPASSLFMPLSFAAILGGTCTLIGTSTNLVVHGLIQQHNAAGAGLEQIGMFTLAWVGVPVTLAGVGYMLLFGRRWLRDTESMMPSVEDPREYMTSMRVAESAGVGGQSIEQAGLRHLPGLYLSRIERAGEQIYAVDPNTKLHGGDVLIFVGNVKSVADLQRIKGLEPVTSDEVRKGLVPRHRARLIEAVVSSSSPMLGVSIREGEFRSRYGAVVIAAHRSGERIAGKLGDIRLRAGDTLLLEAPGDFVAAHADSKDFYLVSELESSAAPGHHLAWAALLVLAALILGMTIFPTKTMIIALTAALAMIALRCCTGPQARAALDWQVFVVIGAAFGLGAAMERSGLAELLARGVMGVAQPMGLLAVLGALYLITALFTNVVTNNAAAVLMFPIALEAWRAGPGWSFLPFAAVIAVAASAGFATPIGYQTNLMVMGPGGYRPTDFLRFGGPLVLITGVVCVLLSPLVFG
ncbi:MAG: SLC13 family permease [Phycisphaeraceae bacterium]|nr:SLC13 family permease [Phycisphaeraceae bacterium]